MSCATPAQRGGVGLQDPDGGYRAYVWVTLPDGRRRRKYVYGKTREEVQAKWTALQERARRGPGRPQGPRPCKSYMNGWLENVDPAGARAVDHPGATRCACGSTSPPLIGSRRLDQLTVSDVQAWVNKLRRQCQCCAQGKDAKRDDPECCAIGTCCRQLPSDSTVHQAWRVLRGRAELRPSATSSSYRNVASLVRMPMPRSPRAMVWTVDRGRAGSSSPPRADHDPLYAAYVLLLVLGLRRGEVLGLAWDDVDLEKRPGPHRLAAAAGRATSCSRTPDQDPQLRRRPPAARRLPRRAARSAAPSRTAAARAGRRGLARLRPRLHLVHRRPARPPQLPPLLQGARRGRRRPGDLRPLDPAHLRLPARRSSTSTPA